MAYRHEAQFKLRMPADVKAFLAEEAERNASSQGSEIVRAVRERMDRIKAATGQSLPAHPVAVSHDTACQGGPEIHG